MSTAAEIPQGAIVNVMNKVMNKVHFVGAGPGAVDLITVRGKKLLENADVVIYAGSLVNPALLEAAPAGAEIYNSAELTLDEVIDIISKAHKQGKNIVRLHTGDPGIYGAVREQFDKLAKQGIEYDICPGVSSFCAATAALSAELTLPGVSQTVIISRAGGRTPVPESETLASLATHNSTMVLFLSAGMLKKVQDELIAGGIKEETPAAIVYKASWKDERVIRGTVGKLAEMGGASGIEKTALIIVGNVLGNDYELSKLYSPDFSTEFRSAKQGNSAKPANSGSAGNEGNDRNVGNGAEESGK